MDIFVVLHRGEEYGAGRLGVQVGGAVPRGSHLQRIQRGVRLRKAEGIRCILQFNFLLEEISDFGFFGRGHILALGAHLLGVLDTVARILLLPYTSTLASTAQNLGSKPYSCSFCIIYTESMIFCSFLFSIFSSSRFILMES